MKMNCLEWMPKLDHSDKIYIVALCEHAVPGLTIQNLPLQDREPILDWLHCVAACSLRLGDPTWQAEDIMRKLGYEIDRKKR